MRTFGLVLALCLLVGVVGVAAPAAASHCSATNTSDPCVSFGFGIYRCTVRPLGPELFYCAI